MPDNTIIALVAAIGTGIINISVGITLVLLIGKGKTANIAIGWGVFVILCISILGFFFFLAVLGDATTS